MQPKHESGYRVGIVNPMTLVGNEIKNILRERSFPYSKLVLLDTTGESAGALTEVDDEPAMVTPTSAPELEDCDLVFFCGPAEANRGWLDHTRKEGLVAIDLSYPTISEDAALAVAGVNVDDAIGHIVVVSPHPVVVPIALILHQIESIAHVEFCAATVIQPASEFDQAGIDELAKQTIAVLNAKPIPQEVFDRQLAFNLYPSTRHAEPQIVGQLRRLVDPRVEVTLMLTLGTIFHGHTFSLFIRTQESLDSARIVGALKQNPALAFAEGDQALGTIDAAGRDEVLIAEVRADPSIKGGFWVWAVCDNLRRGSALNAVLVAEKVLFGSTVN